jgi:hemerythrin
MSYPVGILMAAGSGNAKVGDGQGPPREVAVVAIRAKEGTVRQPGLEMCRGSEGHVLDVISEEHEQLRMVLVMAQRCAAKADSEHCRQVLRWALQLLEQHCRTEESVLTRHAYRGIHGVRRDHEQIVVSLEQALSALERDDGTEVADLLGRVGGFLAGCIDRDAEALRRTLTPVDSSPLPIRLS